MTLQNKDLQTVLKAAGYYNGAIDGILGNATLTGANTLLSRRADLLVGNPANWNNTRRIVAAAQIVLKFAGYDPGAVDGLIGPGTIHAFESWEYAQENGKPEPAWRPDNEDNGQQELNLPVVSNDWGRQRDMEKRFGPAGGPQCYAGIVTLPYRMKIAWDLDDTISTFRCHEDLADSVERVLARVASAYSPAEIEEYGLNLFGGCYNYRNMRGGSTLSTHAYGAAIDFDPLRNQLRWNATRATLALPEVEEFWLCWEAEGWTSLGKVRNYDWMHVQAPRL